MTATAICNLCGSAVDVARMLAYRKDGFDIVRCPRCSLVFRVDPPREEELQEIYGDAYFAGGATDERGTGYGDYLAEEEGHRRLARKRLELLSRFLPPGGLLDVGCAAGFFVDEACRAGWSASGVDVSPTMARHARERLGLAVTPTPFLRGSAGTEYDAITMWDYLEHVLDPSAEMARAAQSLRPGGVLALSTGDIGSWVARISGRSWHLLTPAHHNYFFSRATLDVYLEQANLHAVYVGYPGGTYSLRYVLHKAQTLTEWQAARGAARALGHSPVGRLRVPLNLRDIMTVVARRP